MTQRTNITGWVSIMEANTAKGLLHTAGMTTGQQAEYHRNMEREFRSNRTAKARANGFSSAEKMDAAFDYAHGR